MESICLYHQKFRYSLFVSSISELCVRDGGAVKLKKLYLNH